MLFFGIKLAIDDSIYGSAGRASFVISFIGLVMIFTGVCTADYNLLKNKEDAVAQCEKDNYAIYVNGNPVDDDFFADGINLKKYTVKVCDKKLLLISY